MSISFNITIPLLQRVFKFVDFSNHYQHTPECLIKLGNSVCSVFRETLVDYKTIQSILRRSVESEKLHTYLINSFRNTLGTFMFKIIYSNSPAASSLYWFIEFLLELPETQPCFLPCSRFDDILSSRDREKMVFPHRRERERRLRNRKYNQDFDNENEEEEKPVDLGPMPDTYGFYSVLGFALMRNRTEGIELIMNFVVKQFTPPALTAFDDESHQQLVLPEQKDLPILHLKLATAPYFKEFIELPFREIMKRQVLGTGSTGNALFSAFEHTVASTTKLFFAKFEELANTVERFGYDTDKQTGDSSSLPSVKLHPEDDAPKENDSDVSSSSSRGSLHRPWLRSFFNSGGTEMTPGCLTRVCLKNPNVDVLELVLEKLALVDGPQRHRRMLYHELVKRRHLDNTLLMNCVSQNSNPKVFLRLFDECEKLGLVKEQLLTENRNSQNILVLSLCPQKLATSDNHDSDEEFAQVVSFLLKKYEAYCSTIEMKRLLQTCDSELNSIFAYTAFMNFSSAFVILLNKVKELFSETEVSEMLFLWKHIDDEESLVFKAARSGCCKHRDDILPILLREAKKLGILKEQLHFRREGCDSTPLLECAGEEMAEKDKRRNSVNAVKLMLGCFENKKDFDEYLNIVDSEGTTLKVRAKDGQNNKIVDLLNEENLHEKCVAFAKEMGI